MGQAWYVLLTIPRAEYLAAAELEKDEFQVFFPRVKAPHSRLGHQDEPLFPGYLFLRLDIEETGLPSFRPSHKIVGWVKFGNILPTVPDVDISELSSRLEAVNSGDSMWRRYQPGESVRVISGNIDKLGEVLEEGKSAQGRVRVLMEFMGRQIPVQVPWGDLQPIDHQTDEIKLRPRRTRGRGRWTKEFRPEAVVTA